MSRNQSKFSFSFGFRFLRVVFVLIIAIGLAKMLVVFKKEPEKKEIVKKPSEVKIIVANPVSREMKISAYGVVKPRKSVEIIAEVSGKIDLLSSSFIEGGMIQENETLIKIDQRTYELNKQTQQARVEQAKIDIENLNQTIQNLKKDKELADQYLKLVQKEFERAKKLSLDKYISTSNLDKIEQQYLQAKIQQQTISNNLALAHIAKKQKQTSLNMAKLDLKQAMLAHKKTFIKAPFQGFVTGKYVEQGEFVNIGKPLGTIYQKDMLDVDISLPVEKMKWLDLRKNIENISGKLMLVQKDQGYVWNVKLARLKAKIDEKTRTLPITLEIDVNSAKIISKTTKQNFIPDLKPGTFVKCILAGDIYENIFVLPRYLEQQENTLFLLKKGRLKMQKINIFRKLDDEIYINDGLKSGDKIIVTQLSEVIDNMLVKSKQ